MNTTRLSRVPLTFSILTLALLAAGVAQARNALDGRLRVVNERPSPIQVSIDGDRLTHLGPGEDRTFRDVPNGVRLLRVHGAAGRHEETERVQVPAGGLAVHRVEARFAQATIYNDSGVRMRLVLDGRHLGVARPGESLESWPLPAGVYTLEAKPADRAYLDGPILTQRVGVRPGERARVAVGAWFGRLEVHNPFAYAANLFVDGQRIDTLRPGETRMIARQVPGAHRMVLRRHGRVLAADTVKVAPGESAFWRPIDRNRGDLRVSNRTGTRVEVLVDGRSMGRLGRGESRLFADIEAGVHVVTLMKGGRVVEQQRIRVAAHDVAEMVAYRPAPPARGPRDRPVYRPDAPGPIARR